MKGHTLPGIKPKKKKKENIDMEALREKQRRMSKGISEFKYTDPDAPGTPGKPGYEPPVRQKKKKK